MPGMLFNHRFSWSSSEIVPCFEEANSEVSLLLKLCIFNFSLEPALSLLQFNVKSGQEADLVGVELQVY